MSILTLLIINKVSCFNLTKPQEITEEHYITEI